MQAMSQLMSKLLKTTIFFSPTRASLALRDVVCLVSYSIRIHTNIVPSTDAQRSKYNNMAKQQQTENCSICMDAMKEPAGLSGCTHMFCKNCIFEWSKRQDTCPNCRAPFEHIQFGRRRIMALRRRHNNFLILQYIMMQDLIREEYPGDIVDAFVMHLIYSIYHPEF